MGEEKVIDNFAYSFAWGLYIMCRDPLQKDRGRGDVFFEGCVWKWKEGGGCGVGGGYLYEVTEEKVIDGIVHPFAYRAWTCALARHGGRGVKKGDERKRVEGEGGSEG